MRPRRLAVLGLALAAYVAYRYRRRRRFMRESAVARITGDELFAQLERGEAPVILDVRSVAALQLDPRQLPGALCVDLADLRSQAASLPRNRDIVVYCNCPNEASAAMAAVVRIGVVTTERFWRAGTLEAAMVVFAGIGLGAGLAWALFRIARVAELAELESALLGIARRIGAAFGP